MPNNFAETSTGKLLIASGMDPVLVWDGFAAQALTAGVPAPPNAIALSGSGVGSITGTYTAYQRWLDSEGNPSNFSPVSAETAVSGASLVTYTGVDAPTNQKVVRRQILRNTAGQASTYYVAVDTTDLVSATFSDSLDDTTLSNQEAVPFLDANNTPFANRYGVPPNHKAALQNHLNRMFAAAEVAYDQGQVEVTFGSATITGVGTEWTTVLKGRFLYVVGAPAAYEIASVDTVNQVITLLLIYHGPTDLFAVYAIRPAPAERRLVYYSESGLPEAWPAINALEIQDDGDEITGLMAKGSFIYILERRHIYRFTFQGDPALDGFIFLASVRGCVNQRCWVQAEDIAYMLDEKGIHAFDGGQASDPISVPVQDLFRPSDSPYRINWRASDWFHACDYPTQECVRWFVAMSGESLPRHAICYNYRAKRWWLEEYPFPVGASCTGVLRSERRVLVGGEANRIWALGEGNLDGPTPGQGTIRGTVTSATLTSLTDAGANYASSGLVGYPLTIVTGTGKGQQRLITQVSATTITVSFPWLILPDTTSVYQVGGISWRVRFGDMRFAVEEDDNVRRLALVFQPTINGPAAMDLRLYYDFSPDPYVMQIDRSSAEDNGVASTKGSADLVVDLTKGTGQVQKRIDGHREIYTDGPRWLQVELGGVTNRDQVTVYEVDVDGVTHVSQ